jgi:pimeloyl-ACP methyl ester carboxylesterase
MSTPDTVVLIHGFWVTPRSWVDWITRYERKGFRVLAPAYPGFEVEVEALRADPRPIAETTLPKIVAHLESVIGDLPAAPILMGHSAGGLLVQLLLDRRHGAAGVAINSAPTEGVKVVPVSQIRSTFAVFRRPGNRHRAIGFSFEQWRYAFTNTFPEDEARRLYERLHIPAPGSVIWGNLFAGVQPGHQDTWVDYDNDHRAPLLFLSGTEDHLMPPSVQRANLRHYRSDTVTELKEFEGRAHLMPLQEGWEEVADHALDWAVSHARQTATA